jgi:hypothetical protein
MWVLVEAHVGHIPHRGHHPCHRPVHRQIPWLRLLLALVHDLNVAMLLEVSDMRLHAHLVDTHALLVVSSKTLLLLVCYPPMSMSISRL